MLGHTVVATVETRDTQNDEGCARFGGSGALMRATDQDTLEQIKSIVTLSSVIRRKVPSLKRSGREYIGLCPFHADRKPSLTVNDQKSLFKCFPCGAHGDQFTFLMKTEGLSFPESVERLAKEAGVTLPKTTDVKTAAKRLTLIDVCERVQQALVGHLAANPAARAYLTNRKITPAICGAWGLGYAPSEKGWLRNLGIEVGLLAEAGLMVTGEDIPVAYERFRDRITIPIRNSKGRVIGFGGRALDHNAQAKYINPPETPIFHKGSVLFNADKAREAAWNGEQAVLVEGYFGTIMSASVFPATVASMGTAVTEDHLRSLWRMSDEPVICLDGDSAGRKAIQRTIETALPLLIPGRTLRFAYLPSGLDPDDLIRQRGPEAYRSVINASERLLETLWRVFTEGRLFGGPDERGALEGSLMASTGLIKIPQLRRKYEDEYRKRIAALGKPLRVNRSNSNSHHSTSPGSIRLVHGIHNGGMSLRDAMIVAAAVASPSTTLQVMERLSADVSLSGEASAAVRTILDVLAELPEADAKMLTEALGKADALATVTEAREICHRAGISSLDQDGEAAASVLLKH